MIKVKSICGGMALEIVRVHGEQLEKSSPTSPEDGFIRSEVYYKSGDEERVLTLLYLEFFQQDLSAFTPFEEDPIYTVGEKEFYFKEIAALAALINNPFLEKQKRVDKHDIEAFHKLYENIDWDTVKQAVMKIANNAGYPLTAAP